MAPHPEEEDIELGEHEDDAFIPTSASKPLKHDNFMTRAIPSDVFAVLESVHKVRAMLFLLGCFLFLFAWIILSKTVVSPIVIPVESLALQSKLLISLKGSKIPDYVLIHAPLVYLDKSEHYYPSDIGKHIRKTHPTLHFASIESKDLPGRVTLENLDKLNELGGEAVYLTSIKNLIDLPKFLKGKKPDSTTLQTHKAKTAAVMVVEKDGGITDAFYMYFYSFNAGPSALGHTAGNHLGDWEHSLIRFKDGKPQAVWYSQHEYGAAYTFEAVNKVNNSRPLVYSSRGSHANYAKPGKHDLHDQVPQIPARIVFDYTSAATLWDPTLSAYYYTYDPLTTKVTPALPDTPDSWLYFKGRWGDDEYPNSKKGQEEFHGFHKWTAGPQGPLFKSLERDLFTKQQDSV